MDPTEGVGPSLSESKSDVRPSHRMGDKMVHLLRIKLRLERWQRPVLSLYYRCNKLELTM